MRPYSFIVEANVAGAVKKAAGGSFGKTAFGAAARMFGGNATKAYARNAAVGAVAGGAINKMRGGSFTKGAAAGAAVGAGATYAGRTAITNKWVQQKALGRELSSRTNKALLTTKNPINMGRHFGSAKGAAASTAQQTGQNAASAAVDAAAAN